MKPTFTGRSTRQGPLAALVSLKGSITDWFPKWEKDTAAFCSTIRLTLKNAHACGEPSGLALEALAALIKEREALRHAAKADLDTHTAKWLVSRAEYCHRELQTPARVSLQLM